MAELTVAKQALWLVAGRAGGGWLVAGRAGWANAGWWGWMAGRAGGGWQRKAGQAGTADWQRLGKCWQKAGGAGWLVAGW